MTKALLKSFPLAFVIRSVSLAVSLAGVLTFVGCSSQPTTPSTDNRQPSSVDSNPAPGSGSMSRLENTYNDIVNSADPVAAMEGYLGSLRKIYYRCETRLQAFDRALDKKKEAFELTDLPEYRDILVMREIKERMMDKIEFVYKHLQEDAASTQAPEMTHANATKVLASLKTELAAKDARKQVVYHDLKVRLDGADQGQRHSDDARFVELVKKTRGEMQRLGAIEEQNSAGQDDAVSADIKESKNRLDVDLTQQPRDPQSTHIAPSTGPGGSISGFEFPAGTWALTYDDGPHPTYTMEDLSNLRAHGMKATFFWLAMNIIPNSGIVQQVRAAGYPTENHSYTHPNLASARDLAAHKSSLQHEIVDSTAVDVKAYGEHPPFFRCPYGSGIHSPAVRQLIADQGMINVFWDVDSLDWQDHNPNSILARVQKQMATQRRGIILFHDIHPQSVVATNMLMSSAKDKFNWVTIPEIVSRLNGGN